MVKKTDDTIKMFGLSFVSNTRAQLLNEIISQIESSSRTTYIFTPNPEQIVQANQDRNFQEILQQGDLLLPDGVGLIWASKLFSSVNKNNQSIKQKIAGVDVVHDLLLHSAKKNWKILVIGGRNYDEFTSTDHSNDQSILDQKNLPSDFCSLSFQLEAVTIKLKWTSGYVSARHATAQEEDSVSKLISMLKPDLIFIAFGAPQQEKWVLEHGPLLNKSNVKIAMVIGGSMDFLIGKIPRAPYLLRKIGLEWLFRLILQPWRLSRQLRLIVFIKLVVKELIFLLRVHPK